MLEAAGISPAWIYAYQHTGGLLPRPDGSFTSERGPRCRGGQGSLIPQVYLHYDPHARSHYPPGAAPLSRQRMDFLMLLPHRVRVVIECDGVQHYADDQVLPNKRRYASPRRYAEMVAEDRELRLAGYEVYRFGGVDLVDSPDTARRLDDFFSRLADRHGA